MGIRLYARKAGVVHSERTHSVMITNSAALKTVDSLGARKLTRQGRRGGRAAVSFYQPFHQVCLHILPGSGDSARERNFTSL